MDGSERGAYVIPRYRAPSDTAFYHFLHGTVPGHQIDFMYCPEVPQGSLAQTHYGHLARLIKYIEPRHGLAYAFALGNLSRDDVQHEPGHGGVAILFALRVPGVTDHAGRDMPPYAHGIVAVDRRLEYVQLLEAMTVLYRRFLEREGAEDRRGDFYRSYVRTVQERPEEVEAFLANAIAEIDDIPNPPRSKLGFDFELEPGASPPPRISIVHDDDEGFGTLAHHAATLGSALYRSNIKWTSITSGREIDIPGGTTIRFTPRSEAPDPSRGPVFTLDDLPDDEEALLKLLFGGRRRVEQVAAPRQGWREKLAAQQRAGRRSERPPGGGGPSRDSQDGDIDVEIDDAATTLVAGLASDGTPRGGDVPAGGFDPRRSSPVTGVAAEAAHGSRAAVGASSAGAAQDVALPSPPVAAIVPPVPPSAPGPAQLIPTHLERSGAPAQRGRWIIAAAAFAAVIVVVIVAVVAGVSMQDDGAGEGGGAPGPTGTAPSGAGTTPPGPVSAPPGPVSAPPTASSTTSPGPSASPSASSSAAPEATGSRKGRKPTLMGPPKW